MRVSNGPGKDPPRTPYDGFLQYKDLSMPTSSKPVQEFMGQCVQGVVEGTYCKNL